MANKDESRIFVGGLSWETTDRQLEKAFGRFGKILEAQVMLERDTGRPRGFGFVTFADRRAMDDAIAEMDNQDLDGHSITVNQAQPKPSYESGGGYDLNSRGSSGRGYSSGVRGGGGSYRDRDRDRAPLSGGNSDCFKCGKPGHWARECPSDNGGGRFPPRSSRFEGGGGRGDRFGGRGDRFGGDRFGDDRYDGGRYGDRDRNDTSNGRDRYVSDRYSSGGAVRYGAGDRYSSAGVGDRYSGGGGGDRYSGGGGGDMYGGVSDRYPQNRPGKEKSNYDRDGPRGGGGDRYGGGGPVRYEGGAAGGRSYKERPGPYDRPSRVSRPLSSDR